MEQNLSQSSCEIISDIKNLELCSESEILSSQISEPVEGSAQLEVKGRQDSTSGISESPAELSAESSTSSGSSYASSSATTSSSAAEPEQQTKRKRKRKRKRKTKTSTAYSPPTPFTARYKRLKLSAPVAAPKLHLRFNENDEPDQTTSDYNVKARIVSALIVNLKLSEELRNVNEKTAEGLINRQQCQAITEDVFESLKPRIIKAIII